MADLVQKNMEEMIPELESLAKCRLFTQAEIKAIVKRRRHFEYAVQRRGAEKFDFLRYIQYEMNLDLLRRRRKGRMGIRKLPELSEFSGVRRIHFLYHRLLRKFGEDVKLWLQYIDFCKNTGSVKALNRTFARALRAHPTSEGLWIMAASWEFEHNSNIIAARALMQRSIRINKHCGRLWHEYCRLELLYLQKIKDRIKLLGVENAALVPKEENENDEINKDDDEANGWDEDEEAEDDKEEKEEGEQQRTKVSAEGDPSTGGSNAGTSNPFLEGAIPRLIFKNACASEHFQGDWKFVVKFVEIFRAFENTERIVEEVYQTLLDRFPRNEECWSLWAKKELDDLAQQPQKYNDGTPKGEVGEEDERKHEKAMDRAFELFEEAVGKLSTAQMWEKYATFCQDMMLQQIASHEKYQLHGEEENQQNNVQRLAKRLLDVCRRANSHSLMTEDLFCLWVEAILNDAPASNSYESDKEEGENENEGEDNALRIAQLGTSAFPSSSRLWLLRVKLAVRQSQIVAALKRTQQHDDEEEQNIPATNNKRKRKSGGNEKQKEKQKRSDDSKDVAEARQPNQMLVESAINQLFVEALEACPESLPLRAYFLEYCLIREVPWDTFLLHFRRAMMALVGHPEVNALKEQFLMYTTSCLGIDKTRQLYTCALDFAPNMISFYQKCIQAEKAQLPTDASRVRALYRRALDDHGDFATGLWLEWIKLERAEGQWKTANGLYWQAKKRLADPTLFVEEYELIK
ncbi:U3 snoRNP protein [Balamuthia mandrillaris]